MSHMIILQRIVKILIESQPEKKIMFHNADKTNLSQNVSLEKENIKVSNTSSNLISIEKLDYVQKEMVPIPLIKQNCPSN